MLLADTNVVLRLILEPEKLSLRAMDALREASADDGLAIAAISLWEIALLQAKGKIELDSAVESFLGRIETVFHVLPLNREIAIRGASLSKNFPRDPADRQIAATAVIHGLALVTSDGAIRKSGEVKCIW